MSSFVVAFREGMEAFLIVGILLTYLTKLRQTVYLKHVLGGTGAAIVASLLTALGLWRVAGGFSGRAEEIFEGTIMLIAVWVLTYMVLWMGRQARAISGQLRRQVDVYVSRGQALGLVALSFVSVYREGVETVLFFAALGAKGMASWIGGVVGLLAAAAVVGLFFRLGQRLPLHRFFQVTGAVLIVVAAGLAAGGVHELQEAGVLPMGVEHLYDLNPAVEFRATPALTALAVEPGWDVQLGARGYAPGDRDFLRLVLARGGRYASSAIRGARPALADGLVTVATPVRLAFHEEGAVGRFLTALVGYNANPSLLEVLTYLLYLFIIWAALRWLPSGSPPSVPASQRAG